MKVTEAPQALRETAAPDDLPIRVLEVELGEPLASISACDPASGIRYRQALCLIRFHTQPLGLLRFDLLEETLSAEDYAKRIWAALASEIQDHCRNDALPCPDVLTSAGLTCPGVPACIAGRQLFLADAPFVTVAVATHNRAESLHRCLDALCAMDYPPDRYEIIVVDNAPGDNATVELVQQMATTAPRLRYVREDRPGVSYARNRALREARGQIIAMTDDDVRVDSHWLVELVRSFRLSPNAACVTGLIMPAELETPAQVWFE